MIATSKLNSSIVFSLAIFWGLRADEMGTKERGVERRGPRKSNKGRGSRDTNTLPKVLFMTIFFPDGFLSTKVNIKNLVSILLSCQEIDLDLFELFFKIHVTFLD